MRGGGTPPPSGKVCCAPLAVSRLYGSRPLCEIASYAWYQNEVPARISFCSSTGGRGCVRTLENRPLSAGVFEPLHKIQWATIQLLADTHASSRIQCAPIRYSREQLNG